MNVRWIGQQVLLSWLLMLPGVVRAAAEMGTDGVARPVPVEYQSIPAAVREMGSLSVFLVCGVLLVGIGATLFLVRVLRHRRKLRDMERDALAGADGR